MRKTIAVILGLMFLLSVPFSTPAVHAQETSNNVVNYAKNFLGTPYKFGGTSPSGFDCSGFINYVFDEFGVDLPRTTAEIYNVGKSVSKSNLQSGDLVFFETYKAGASHMGIYVGNDQFIHASTSRGVAIDSLNSSYWKPKYIGAKRIATSAVLGVSTGPKLATKPGQIGEIEIKKAINLWQRDENNKLTFVRILKPGEIYRVYNEDSLYGGQYGLGAGMYITNMPAHITYIPVLGVTTGPKLATKPGQIGEIEIKKAINLWQRDENNKLTFVRILKPGEIYRVYNEDSLYGGQYGLGAGMYITNMPAHITYTPLK